MKDDNLEVSGRGFQRQRSCNLKKECSMDANVNENIHVLSASNLYDLMENSYPGQGIILGMDEEGEGIIQVYWIMGRSENSRNRVFRVDGGRVFTVAVDPKKVKDPSLIIYNGMREQDNCFVVSNGEQTDAVLPKIVGGKKLISSLKDYQYEPHAPNFTSRITGAFVFDDKCPFGLAILRKSLWDDSCDRLSYYYEKIKPGFGFCITTYSCDGNPLPAFMGEPLLMPLMGGIKSVAHTYWRALNEENRVALAVKFISMSGRASQIEVINKYSKV